MPFAFAMKNYQLQLGPGIDLREAIENFGLTQNLTGFIGGIVGNLSKANFQCPGFEKPTTMEGNLEIITLNGTYSPSNVHLHLSFSDEKCKVWGGHLERGSLVLKTADILLVSSEGISNHKIETSPEVAQESINVDLAVLPNCPWCSRAIRIMNSNNIRYNLVSVDNDETFDFVKKMSGSSTFPQLFINKMFIGGYDEIALRIKSGALNKELNV